MSQSQTYIPGMCNINKEEVAYRKKAMWLGIGVSIVVFAALVLLGINVWFRLVLIAPLFVAAIGYLQAKNKFCVGYGSAGKQNATDGNETAEVVTDKAALAADKKRSKELNLKALAISVVVLAVLMLVPNF